MTTDTFNGIALADREPEWRVKAADRRARAIRKNTRERVELVTRGLEAGDWRTLGYDSPSAWYAALSDYMLAPPDIRRRLAAAMRTEGYSLRGIATELDVSKSTIERDLDQVSHDETPATVTGTDGKSYPSARTPPPDLTVFGPGTGRQQAGTPGPEDLLFDPGTGRRHPRDEFTPEQFEQRERWLSSGRAHCDTCTCYAADGET